MKTLIINGSLKGETSHSYMVASRFARGIDRIKKYEYQPLCRLLRMLEGHSGTMCYQR